MQDGAARLRVLPNAPTEGAAIGVQPLGLAAGRDGLLCVPRGYRSSSPSPLLVLLHGAGGVSSDWLSDYRARADAEGIVVLAPDSRGATWDAIRRGFGPDVAFLSAALAATFRRVAVDARRIAIAGFSDGASYALSLGLANGDVISRVVAYSPGFVIDARRVGRPGLFVSHGTADFMLPIATTSRRIVPNLRRDGYGVEYVEFEGGHEMPPPIADRALSWLTKDWR